MENRILLTEDDDGEIKFFVTLSQLQKLMRAIEDEGMEGESSVGLEVLKNIEDDQKLDVFVLKKYHTGVEGVY